MIHHISDTSDDFTDIGIMTQIEKQVFPDEELQILKALDNSAIVNIINDKGIILSVNELYKEVS
jgi:hypothetical protein